MHVCRYAGYKYETDSGTEIVPRRLHCDLGVEDVVSIADMLRVDG